MSQHAQTKHTKHYWNVEVSDFSFKISAEWVDISWYTRISI
jgi:hypothetical protein